MSKIFLSDVDGVLVDFSRTFEKWIQSIGLKTSSPYLVTPAKYFKIKDWVIDPSVTNHEELVTEFFESDFAQHSIPWIDSLEIRRLSDSG